MANFTIVESTDGTYFTITDTRIINSSYIISIQSNQMSNTGQQLILLNNAQRTALATGLNLTANGNFGYTETEFVDGIYDFIIQKDAGSLELSTEAFAAVITAATIPELLNYRTYIDFKTKEGLLEKNRLLNNLAFSAQIGSQNHFLENLQALQLLQ